MEVRLSSWSTVTLRGGTNADGTHGPRLCGTHKKLEELEDPLVCENIKCISRDGVNDRQAVNFVFDEGVHCVKQAATQRDTRKWPITRSTGEIRSHAHRSVSKNE